MKRKRLITLLMFFCILAGNAWGDRKLYFEYNVKEYSNSETASHYYQPLLWLWDDTSTTENPTNITGDLLNDFTITVSTTGSMAISDGHYKKKVAVESVGGITRYEYVLNDLEIYFEGTSGTIKVTATNPDYGGVTYTASYTISYHMNSTKWSFYSEKLAVGRMKDDGTGGTTESSLHQHASDWALNTTGGKGEYVYFYNNSIGSKTSVETSEGSGEYVDVITPSSASFITSETDGLLFYAPAGTFGLYNESDSVNVASSDRFIALKQDAEVIIPASKFTGLTHPRIRIKMGRYGAPTSGPHSGVACIDLTITNGKDALGNNITGTGTYTIGGSAWWGTKRDPHQRGEYHFQVQDPSQDFIIKVEHGQWLKLYTIEVYNSEEILTENSVLGTNYQLLTKRNGDIVDASKASGTYYLHYRGKGEHTKVYTNQDYKYVPTGTVECNSSNFTNNTSTGGENHTYTATTGQFGTFQIQLRCYTHYNNYCTDYADRSQAVGYLETKTYPYTWDFTDVATYEEGPGRMGTANTEIDANNYGEGDYAYYTRFNKRFHWYQTGSGNYGHRVGVTADGHKITFCGGSQLWYGKTIIPELAGLGFTPSNYSSAYNNTLQILSGTSGIKIDQNTTTWWCYRVAVPNVPADGAVYVRVHPERALNNAYYNVGYSYGDYVKPIGGNPGNVEIAFGSEQDTHGTYHALATDGSGDMIYVVPGNATSASSNITLYFNGVTIKKIAVSTDLKAVNKYGWTTESRPHDIDPELTSYMTGQNFKNFLVTGADYSAKRVTMTPIANNTVMHAAGTDDSPENGSPNAYIIQNTAGSTVNIVNGGFHLFVPDMHESDEVSSGVRRKPYVDTSSSLLKAQVTATTDETKIQPKTTDGGTTYTNYAFTYKHWKLDDEGNKIGDMMDGPQAFYRIAKGGASSIGNQAYLPVESSRAEGARGFYMDFGEDEDPGSHGTAVEVVKSTVTKSDVYYNLNGQQMNGKPAKGGIYIHNGKKVVIK